MKKLFLALAAAVLTVSVSAQEKEVVTAHKTFDNWYLGINAGAATPMQEWGDAGFMKGMAPSVGLRLGKNFTTSFGLAVDGNAYFESNDKSLMNARTFIDAINVDALGTLNLSNFFGGYLGKPRRVELIALGGFGWTHQFGLSRANGINSKVALDLAFNLGANRAVQFYLEPALVFGLWDNGRMANALSRHADGIYICDECGTAEAMLDFMNNPLPTEMWAMFSVPRQESDLKDLPGEEVWKRIRMEHGPILIDIFKRWTQEAPGANFTPYRWEAFKRCPGLTEIWEQPFQAKYDVADGELILRLRHTDNGVEIAADLLESTK